MEPHRSYSFPSPALTTTRPFSASASDLSCHNPEQKSEDHDNNNHNNNMIGMKYSQVVMVNEHKEPDDDDNNKKSKLFWKRNRKRNSKKIGSKSNPTASILVVSTRKQHKKQPLGITLRQETSNSGSKSRGVYLLGIAPHSPFRAASRFVPHGSKILLVNGQPCPSSVKEVANRLLQVPQGAVLTLHFEVDTIKNSATRRSSSKLSLFRRSSNSTLLNPVDVGRHNDGGPDYAFQQNLQYLQQRKLPPSILKETPKYSNNHNALVNGGCSGSVPSAMHMIMQTAALPYQAAKVLHNEAVSELDQLGKFLTQSWSGGGDATNNNKTTNRFVCTDVTASLIEETNNRWSRIRADELAEF